jgi:branched-subunit amino acid aminotransferase/4-amino-4-deoxychorismate lyase
MKRFNDSCERLSLPTLDQQGLLDCIKHLVKVNDGKNTKKPTTMQRKGMKRTEQTLHW